MKLENCGKHGIAAVHPWRGDEELAGCPLCGCPPVGRWSAVQIGFHTERINAAALAICTGQAPNDTFEGDVLDAEELIDAQDAAAQARFRAMQGGE